MFPWLESKIYVRYWTCFCNPPHSFDSKTAQTLLIFPDTFLLTQDLAKFTPIWLVLPYGKSHWFQNRHFLVGNLWWIRRTRKEWWRSSRRADSSSRRCRRTSRPESVEDIPWWTSASFPGLPASKWCGRWRSRLPPTLSMLLIKTMYKNVRFAATKLFFHPVVVVVVVAIVIVVGFIELLI